MINLKISKIVWALLISRLILIEATFSHPKIIGTENKMKATSSVIADSEIYVGTDIDFSKTTNKQHSLTQNDESKNEIVSDQTRSLSSRPRVSRSFHFLPSLFSSTSLNRSNIDIIDVHDQVRNASADLLNFMIADADTDALAIPGQLSRNNQDLIVYFNEITDKAVYDILNSLPKEHVPLKLVLETLEQIWSIVKTLKHRAIFEELMKWAILVVSRYHPKKYFHLISFIITNDIQFASYQQALIRANIMTPDQVQLIVDHLLNYFLKADEFGDYTFYVKFNIYFMEIAINYLKFSKLTFIAGIILPPSVHSTPTLELIYYSAPLINLLSHNTAHFDTTLVVSIIDLLTNHCTCEKLSHNMLAEQYQLILDMNRKGFEKIDNSAKVVLLSIISKSLETVLFHSNIVLEIPNIIVFVLLIKGGFNELLSLFMRHLRPIFTTEEFSYLVNAADRLGADESFETLLTLLGSIIVPFSYFNIINFFSESSLRLNLYIEVILSIREQNLAYSTDSDDNPSWTALTSLGKSKSISWTVPSTLNEINYEIVSTSDILMISLLFIKRVFNIDCRKSYLIDKYLRSGKPNFRQFPKIINELLENQCFSLNYQCPIVIVTSSSQFGT